MKAINKIIEYLKNLEVGICVAFSGGVDSTVLLKLAESAGGRVSAVTVRSQFSGKTEAEESARIAGEIGVHHAVLDLDVFEDERLRGNPVDRCYICKKKIFTMIKQYAEEQGFTHVMDGTNHDDLSQYRPGLKAIEELGVLSPFKELAVTKAEIREIAKELGLDIHGKPASPCLATRFPYDTRLSAELLETAADGEGVLKSYGFLDCRLRIHNDIARIEILKNRFEEFLAASDEIAAKIKALGFYYVTLDIEGLRSGSMDKNVQLTIDNVQLTMNGGDAPHPDYNE